MKVRLSALTAIAVMALASSASAGTLVTAKLAKPISSPQKPIANGAIFTCAADTCISNSPPSQTLADRACRQLAKAVGPVSSYGTDDKQFDSAKLGACNGGE
jgi:hypothetical protein